jgi:hypothetical protein
VTKAAINRISSGSGVGRGRPGFARQLPGNRQRHGRAAVRRTEQRYASHHLGANSQRGQRAAGRLRRHSPAGCRWPGMGRA